MAVLFRSFGPRVKMAAVDQAVHLLRLDAAVAEQISSAPASTATTRSKTLGCGSLSSWMRILRLSMGWLVATD